MILVCRWKTLSKLKSLSPLNMMIFLRNSSHQRPVMIMIIFLHWCFNMSTTMNSMGWWKSTNPLWTAIAKVDLSNLIVESLHIVRYLVKLSMKNFMLLPAARPEQSTAEVPEDIETEMPTETFSDCEQGTHFSWTIVSVHLFSSIDEPLPSFNRRGLSGKGDSLVTKHNAEICGKRNVARVMNTFPPEFDTGDVLNKMQLSNRVYNQLKLHSHAEERRMNRLHDKVEKATAVCFKNSTRRRRPMFSDFYLEFSLRSQNTYHSL